mgnify:CR=1 FL=1
MRILAIILSLLFIETSISDSLSAQNISLHRDFEIVNDELPARIAVSPDGGLLAIAYRKSSFGNAIVKTWDVKTKLLRYEREVGVGVIRDLQFSPSSQTLAIVLNELTSVNIRFLDAANGDIKGDYVDRPKLNPRISNSILSVTFSNKDDVLAIAQEDGSVRKIIRLLNIQNLSHINIQKENVFTLDGPQVQSLHFSPDDNYLALATSGSPSQYAGQVIVLDLKSGTTIFARKEFGDANRVRFLPDRRVLASGIDVDRKTGNQRAKAILIDITAGTSTPIGNMEIGGAGEVALVNGTFLWTSSRTGFQLATNRYVLKIKKANAKAEISEIAASSDANVFAILTTRSTIEIFSF